MSHRATIFNDEAREEFIEEFGDVFDDVLDSAHEARGFEDAAEKQVYGSGGFYRSLETDFFFTGVPIDSWADGMRDSLELYRESGITTFASRLGTPLWVSTFHHLLRREGRLPVRFAYSLEIHRGIIPPETQTALYGLIGSQWESHNRPNGVSAVSSSGASKWLWEHGVSSEGAWDSVQRACLGPDLEAVSEEAKDAEACPPLYETGQEVLRNALEDLTRLVGVHMVGSHGARLWIQMVEDAIENSEQLTEEMVREMRLGGAHGTMIGKVPEVIDMLKEYNVYVPVNVARALRSEPDPIQDRYGEEALEFLAPVRTLIDEGVKVVGESENFTPDPQWYFEVLNAYVNRFTREEREEGAESDTEVWVPEEGIDRVEALKLITYRSAEFCLAEDEVGSIEEEKLADFLVCENDVLEASDDELRDNKPILVAVDGEVEHRTDEADDAISIDTGPDAVRAAIDGGRDRDRSDGDGDDDDRPDAGDVDAGPGNATDADENATDVGENATDGPGADEVFGGESPGDGGLDGETNATNETNETGAAGGFGNESNRTDADAGNRTDETNETNETSESIFSF